MYNSLFSKKKSFNKKSLSTVSKFFKNSDKNMSTKSYKIKVNDIASIFHNEEKENIEKNINSINFKPRSSKLNYGSNVLINILKGRFSSSNKPIKKTKNIKTFSFDKIKKNSFPFKSSEIEIPLIFSKKFEVIPNIKKLHYLTNKDLNAIIETNDYSNNYFCLNNNNSANKEELKTICNIKNKIEMYNSIPVMKCIKNKKKNENEKIFSKEIFFNNTISNLSSKSSHNFIIDKNKSFYLRNKLLNKNYLKTRILTENDIDFINQYEKSSKYLYNKNNRYDLKNYLFQEIKTNKKNNKNSSNKNSNSFNKKKNKTLLRRSSVIDRLVFNLERPLDCFEEHVISEKPGDKYQSLKNQLVKEKNKIYKLINDTKLNERKSEALMRKYCYQILSNKNKNSNKILYN